jgi:hypothetical protein
MNKRIKEIKKELEKTLGYNFNNWGKGDLQMLEEIVEASDKVVKNLTLSGVVKSSCDCIAFCRKSENPNVKNCKQQVFPNC